MVLIVIEETQLLQVDGAVLATTIWRGDSKAQPTILVRTPYNRLKYARAGNFWVTNGFAFIAQDTRGCGGSSGSWLPYANEIGDGVATIDWLERQNWFDGRVHVYGESYAAYAALSIASTIQPERIASCVSMMPALGLFQTAFHPSGAFRLSDRIWWDIDAGAGYGNSEAEAFGEVWPSVANLSRRLPVAEIPAMSHALLRSFSRAVEGGHAVEINFSQIKVPLLVLSGWQDCFLESAIALYREADHAPTRMIIGPWNHELETPEQVCDEYVSQALLAWMGSDHSVVEGKHCLIYIMNGGPWFSPTEIPANRLKRTTLFLRPGPTPQEGLLDYTCPDHLPEVGWLCDPSDPHPSLRPEDDRSKLRSRRDWIAYSSLPIAVETLVAGHFAITLYLSSTAPETEVHCTVTLVRSGYAKSLATGIGRFRPANIHSVEEVAITTTPICVRLFPNDVLRLELSSGAFPQYARHPNTLHNPLTAASLAASWQFVQHRKYMPSRVMYEEIITPLVASCLQKKN